MVSYIFNMHHEDLESILYGLEQEGIFLVYLCLITQRTYLAVFNIFSQRVCQFVP